MVDAKETARIQELVKKAYGDIARKSESAGGSGGCGCGCGSGTATSQDFARLLGYTDEQLANAPEGSNLSLGCGNPTAIAELKKGEVVLDLGSGAGFDCFLAARKVGPAGRVIGVDMTPEMIEKARANAVASGDTNVEFRMGQIEELPVEDASVDVVISNCVINLSADKPRVFRELARVLKPGGRIAISDIALYRELPPALAESVAAYTGCISGAMLMDEYKGVVQDAGFSDLNIEAKNISIDLFEGSLDSAVREVLKEMPEVRELPGIAASVYVTARK